MTKVVVYHQYYGCDSGCCGHMIEVDDEEVRGSFDSSHPYGADHLEWAKEFVRENLDEAHVADLDWDNCLVSED